MTAIIRDEMERRFGDRAAIEYLNTSVEDVRTTHAETIARIHEQALVYPVTVIDGRPVYDGSVSYPAIMRAVDTALAERRDA
ncbi:MAG TPA: DUF1462 family protein [Coriobacteriia bacterium]